MTVRSPMVLIGLCAALTSSSALSAPPVYHAGEWQIRINNGPVNVICERKNHVMDQAKMARAMDRFGSTCTPGEFHSSGAITSYSTSCQAAGVHITIHDTVTWQGPDSFTQRIHSHFEGGKTAIPDRDTTHVARRLGPCRPGDRPSPDDLH